jgi:hypothetical protein
MDKPLTVEYAKEIANAFIQTYYQSFDNGPRENLSALYVPDNETSQMSFEGNLIKGQQAIVDKLKSLSFQKVNRCLTAVDSQITVEQGIMINVIGQLQVKSPLVVSQSKYQS